MTDTEKLIAELRSDDTIIALNGAAEYDLLRRAADALEAQSVRIAELEEELEDAYGELQIEFVQNVNAKKRIAELEALVKRHEDALEWMSRVKSFGLSNSERDKYSFTFDDGEATTVYSNTPLAAIESAKEAK